MFNSFLCFLCRSMSSSGLSAVFGVDVRRLDVFQMSVYQQHKVVPSPLLKSTRLNRNTRFYVTSPYFYYYYFFLKHLFFI